MPRWVWFLALSATWGASYFFIAIALRTFGPLTLVAIRMGVATLTLAIVLRAKGSRLPRPDRRYLHLIALGLLNVLLPFAILTWGQQYLSSTLTSILSSTTPVFVFLVAPVLLADEWFAWRKLAGTVIAFAGILVLFGGDRSGSGGHTLIGAAAVVLASLVFALGNVYARFVLLSLPPIVPAFVQSALAFGLGLPAALLLDRRPVGPLHVSTVAAVVWLGAGATAGAYLVYFGLLRDWGSTRTATNTYLQPIVGVLLGVLVLGDRPGGRAWLASAVILAGVLIVAAGTPAPVACRNLRPWTLGWASFRRTTRWR